MPSKLNYEDFLGESLKATRSLIEATKDLKDSLKQIGETSEENLKKLKVSESTEDYAKLQKELVNLQNTQKELQKLTDAENELRLKERDIVKQQIAQQEKLKAEKKALRDEVKLELALQQKSIKSVESLTARNKALTAQARKLNLETAEGVEQYKALTKEILDNKDEIKKLDNEVKQAKISQEAYNKALKIEEDLSKGLIKTKKDLKDANKQLRIAVDNLDIDSQADEIERLNAVIDANSKLIEENSDEQTKAKINVGRYAESVAELLETQGLLSREMEIYNTIMKVANFLTKKNTKETDENAEAKEDLAKATKKAEEASEDLNNSFKKSIIGAIITAVVSLGSAWATTSEGADTFKLVLANINSFIQIGINRLGALANFLIKDTKSAFIGAKKDVNDFKISLLELVDSPKLSKFASKFGVDLNGVSGSLKEAREKSAEFNKEIKDLDAKGQEDLLRATTGFAEQLKDVIARNKLLLAQEKEKLVAGRNLEKQISVQTGLLTRLEQLRDNEALSLTERLALTEKVEETSQRLSKNQIALAKNQLDLTNENIRQRLREQNITRDISDEELRNINNNAKLRKLISTDLLDEQKENQIALIEVQNEAQQNAIDNLNERATLEFDILEQRLDRSIQFNELIIGLNEEIISSDTKSLENKLEAQRKINEEIQKSFDFEISNLVETQKRVREAEIERLKIIGATDEEIAKKRKDLTLEESEIRDLLAIKDSQRFVEELENLKTAERINTRVAELLVKEFENKQKTLDLQKEINEETRDTELLADEILIIENEILETKRVNAELEKLLAQDVTDFTEEELKKRNEKIKALEDELTQIGKDADDERREAKIESLEKELEAVEKGSKRELEIKKELLELEKEAIDQKVEANVEANEEISDNLEKSGEDDKNTIKDDLDTILDFIDNYLKERSKRKLEEIDKEIGAVQSRQQELIALINNGNSDAQASLTALKKEESRLELERKQEQKKAQQQQLILGGLKAFSSALDSSGGNPQQALGQTITSILTLQSFLSSLPTFFDGRDGNGTASVGESQFDKVLNTGKDDFLARIHKNERILPSYMNEKLGGVSNEELVRGYLNRDMNDIALHNARNGSNDTNVYVNDNSALEAKLDMLNSSIKGISTSNISFDEVENLMVKTIREGNKKTNIKRKLNIRKR